MDVVTAPRGEPVDYSLQLGQQPVNPIAQAGQQTAQAIGEARNRQQAFLINQINNQKALELAQWQHQSQMQLAQANHQMQLQRAQIRYQQMIDAAKLKGEFSLQQQKEGEALKSIAGKEAFLTKSLGGAPLSRKEGESDAEYSARLDKANIEKFAANVESDAQKVTSLTVNRHLAQRQYDQAAADPGVQALQVTADNYGKQNAMKLADDAFSKKYGGSLAEVAKQDPSGAQQYAQEYAANLTFFKNQQTAEYLKALGNQGNPVAARLAQYKDQIASIDQQLKQVGTMQGDNGRTVPAVWASDAYNRAQSILNGDAKDADGKLTIDRIAPGYRAYTGQGGPVAAPQGGASASGGNVVAPHIAAPAVQAQGSPVAAPVATGAVAAPAMARPAANSPVTLDNNGLIGVMGAGLSGMAGDIRNNLAASWNHLTVPPPGYAPPVVTRQPPDVLAMDAALAHNFLFGNGGVPPLPPRPAGMSPVVLAPHPNPVQYAAGAMGPQPPVMQQAPQMLAVPPGASISPLSYLPVSQPTPAGAYGNPYGDVGQTLQQADSMSYLYNQ